MIGIRKGSTRVVLLLGPFAIKVPRLHYCGECYPNCFSRFLFGLYGNSVEAARWRKRDAYTAARIARVIFGCSLLLVMERCAPLHIDAVPDDFDGIVHPSEMAPHNFGLTSDGRIVAVDYAFW